MKYFQNQNNQTMANVDLNSHIFEISDIRKDKRDIGYEVVRQINSLHGQTVK